MGGSQSGASEGSRFGLRVVSLSPQSPLVDKVTLYIDFLRGVNGVRNKEIDSEEIRQAIKNQDDTAHLIVYNIVKDEERTVTLKIEWPDQSSPLSRFLGVGTSLESTEDSQNMILRVLNVYPGSPADDAGFSSQHDFIMYCLNAKYKDLDTFCEEIQKICKRPDVASLHVKFIVYNIFHDETRIVSLKPSLDWDPQGGWIGCSFGDGIVDNLRNIQQVLKDRNELLMKNAEMLEETNLEDEGEEALESPTVGKLSHLYPKKKPGKQYCTVISNPHLPPQTHCGPTTITTKDSSLLTQGILFKIDPQQLSYRITTADLISVDKDFNGKEIHPMKAPPEPPMSPRQGTADDVPRPKKYTVVT